MDPKKYWKKLFNTGKLSTLVVPDTGEDVPNEDTLQIKKFLGAGGFGAVFLAYSPLLDRDVAVKFVLIEKDEDWKSFYDEVSAYESVSKSPECNFFVVCLYTSFATTVEGKPVGVFVTELMAGDTFEYPPDSNEMPIFIRSTLEGLAFIHENDFAHRDLKPENVLRSIAKNVADGESSLFKLGDLGLLCGHKDRDDNDIICKFAGTVVFNSPKYLQNWGKKASVQDQQKEDIWEWGMMLYSSIFEEFPPIKGGWVPNKIVKLKQEDLDKALDSKEYPLEENSVISSENIMELIKMSLQINENSRPTAEELIDFFNTHSTAQDELLNSRTVIAYTLDAAKNIGPDSALSSASSTRTTTRGSKTKSKNVAGGYINELRVTKPRGKTNKPRPKTTALMSAPLIYDMYAGEEPIEDEKPVEEPLENEEEPEENVEDEEEPVEERNDDVVSDELAKLAAAKSVRNSRIDRLSKKSSTKKGSEKPISRSSRISSRASQKDTSYDDIVEEYEPSSSSRRSDKILEEYQRSKYLSSSNKSKNSTQSSKVLAPAVIHRRTVSNRKSEAKDILLPEIRTYRVLDCFKNYQNYDNQYLCNYVIMREKDLESAKRLGKLSDEAIAIIERSNNYLRYLLDRIV